MVRLGAGYWAEKRVSRGLILFNVPGGLVVFCSMSAATLVGPVHQLLDSCWLPHLSRVFLAGSAGVCSGLQYKGHEGGGQHFSYSHRRIRRYPLPCANPVGF